MGWRKSNRADPAARVLADRHYNRQKVGSPQFVPPGRCLVLLSDCAKAFWVTSWPFAEYVKHDWAGAWVCSAYRNEGEASSIALIRDAQGVNGLSCNLSANHAGCGLGSRQIRRTMTFITICKMAWCAG